MKRWLLQAMLMAWTAGAQAFTGIVTHVTDGDTVWVGPAHQRGGAQAVKVRLRGIDAPEICQAWGPQAKAALESRVLHRRVQVHVSATDTYERKVGTLKLDGEDVAAWMVAEGHAWNDGYRRRKEGYAALEQQAMKAGRGLFADRDAMPPRRFRQQHGSCAMPATVPGLMR